jgi:hypothetical protein
MRTEQQFLAVKEKIAIIIFQYPVIIPAGYKRHQMIPSSLCFLIKLFGRESCKLAGRQTFSQVACVSFK